MPDRDNLANPLLRLGDIRAALGLLTRLPLRLSEDDMARGAAAAWAYPLAGLCVGLIGAVTIFIANSLGLTPPLIAGIALASMIVTTGALHEDGLADSADGLWGGWEAERRLEIMKDSHIGSYGVIALILSLGLRWVALSTLASMGQANAILAVLIAATLSRTPMVLVMALLPHARKTGLSARVGRPNRATAAVSVVVAGGIGVALMGATVFGVGLVLAGTTLSVAMIAKAKIKGQTGDVLGATQQISEIAVLSCLVAL